MMDSTSLKRLWAVAAMVVGVACGSIQDGLVTGTSRFVSDDYHFEISLDDSQDRAGWFIIKEKDAALTHQYTPPDSSQWFPVAVVVPPTASFPALAPFNVDVFQLKNPAATAQDITDMRVAQVSGDTLLISRRALTVNGTPAEEVVFRQNRQVAVETFLVRSGMGYSINALGSLETQSPPQPFQISSTVYNHVVMSFRFTN